MRAGGTRPSTCSGLRRSGEREQRAGHTRSRRPVGSRKALCALGTRGRGSAPLSLCRHRYFAHVPPADLDVPVLGSTGAEAASVRRYSHTLKPGAGDGTPRASLGSRPLGQEPLEDPPPDPGHHCMQNILRGVSSTSFRGRSVWIARLLPKPKVLELAGYSAFNRT